MPWTKDSEYADSGRDLNVYEGGIYDPGIYDRSWAWAQTKSSVRDDGAAGWTHDAKTAHRDDGTTTWTHGAITSLRDD